MSLPALAVLLSAFLLFLVQPLIGRLVLPWFGGSAAVWTACLVFFQSGLVLGYGYAALAIRLLSPAAQRRLHVTLLAASLLALPLLPDAAWKPADGDDALLRLAGLLAATAGAPYVLLAAARADHDVLPLRLRVPLAIMAGIGFGLKPHFVLIPLTIELYVLYRQGWRDGLRDIVPWIVGLTLAAHVAIALIVTPDYFRIALPLTFKLYTKVSDNSLLSILDGPYLGPTIVALLPLVPAAFILSHSRLVQTLALFSIGAVISATAQGKGWSYQSYPAMTATLMLGAVFLSNLIDRYLPTDSTARRLPVAALAATFMLLLYYQAALFLPPFDKQRDYEESIVARLAHIIEREAPNRTVMVLSPGIYPIYPLANYTDIHLTQRFLDMWPVQGIYAGCDDWGALYHSLESMGQGEKFMFRVVPEDFAKGKPDLVIIDTVPGIPRCQATGFSYLDYFQRNPLFAKTFAKYEKLMDIDRYEIYQRRKPSADSATVAP